MPLRIQVTGKLQESLGAAYMHEFKACGGMIGRSLECDWAIPDAKRYVSSRHAMIDYQAGAYYLVDLSRNGVFVNGADAPLGKGNPQRLFDGDRLRIGEYHMEVAIIEDADEAPEDGMRDSIVRAQMVAEDESMEMSMLAPDAISDDNAFGMLLEPGGATGEVSGLNDVSDGFGPLATRSFTLNDDIQPGADLFIEAAGLDPREFKDIDPQAVLNAAAQVLRDNALLPAVSQAATGGGANQKSGASSRDGDLELSDACDVESTES